MEGEELGGTFVISVDELGLNGLWSTIKDLVESRMPLPGIILPNKVGKQVAVAKLPLMFVLSTDKRLLRLKQYSHSPVTWFRNPHTHLVLVSTADVHEYKGTLRAQLKRVTADIEKDWGGSAVGSEWLILYVRPFELEPSDKGARKVFEKLCDDFGSKRRERVVRLDIPLQAFTAPTAGGSSRAGSRSNTTGGAAPGVGIGVGVYTPLGASPGVWGLGATGLDNLCAGLRDSIRAAFEARQAAYDAEVRRLLNERRDPKWSFTTLYLVKDSFALMLEGAGLWEDAFQEYVELETVYLDTLDVQTAAAGANAADAAAAAVREAPDFGLTNSDSEDIASLLSSSWRKMRRLVLQKHRVEEFHFRQYLFAAQARVLLRLGRPIDVAERGLVFVQNFLTILAAREAAGVLKPWFKECWAFSACMSLITAITRYTAQKHELPADWDVADLLSSGGGPNNPPAQAAMRQLAAAVAAEKAAAAVGSGSLGRRGSMDITKRSTDSDRGRRGSIIAALSNAPLAATPAGMPVLPATDWELDAAQQHIINVVGGSSSSSSNRERDGSSAAAAGEVQDMYEDVPPLEVSVLCGQSITPANAGLLMQGDEQRRELMDKLYCCLLGHLYHLARGELLRLGYALRLPETAAAAKGGASILQLGKAAFGPAPGAKQPAAAATAPSAGGAGSPTKGSSTVTPGGSTSSTVVAGAAGSTCGTSSTLSKGSTAAAGKTAPADALTAGVDLLAAAAAAGALSPRMVAQLQELLLTPLCGFSQMINKYADGSGAGLTYEVHTPKLGPDEDPLAAALTRADSQSTPPAVSNYNSFTSVGSSSSNAAAGHSLGTAVVTGSGVLDRLRRGGSSSSTGNSAFSNQFQTVQPGASRLSKVTGDADDVIEDDSAAGITNVTAGSASDMHRQDSCASLATVNIGLSAGEAASAFSSTAGGVGEDNSSNSGSAAATPAAAAAADGRLAAPDSGNLQRASAPVNSASFSAASGVGLKDMGAGLGLGSCPPRVATHVRSASAMPAAGSVSPGRLEGLVDPGAIAAAGSLLGSSSGLGRGAVPEQLSLSTAAATAAAAAVPSWVGEWRLQLALRNAACFEELLLALSRRAAWCYAKAGRLRSSALIYADVAVLALQRGQLQQAASLLNRMQQIFATEGWQLLLGTVLPKLLAVQRLAAQPLVPFTAVSLLDLPCGAVAAADRQAAFEELLSAVGAVPANSVGVLDTSDLNPATLAGFGNPSPGLVSPSDQQLLQLAMLSAVQVMPAPGTYSHFFGNEAVGAAAAAAAAGDIGQQQQHVPVPLLSPPATPPPAVASNNSSSGSNEAAIAAAAATAAAACSSHQTSLPRGAALIAVGDTLSLAVDVVSELPGPVLLRRLVLSLVQLHKATWVSSAGGNSIFLHSAASTIGPAVEMPGFAASMVSAEKQQYGRGGLGLAGNTDSPRVAVQRWQEGEELLGTKVLAAYTPGQPGDPTVSCSGSSCSGSSSSYCCQMLADGCIIMVPGVNRVIFQLAPVREGLYCLKQLRALIGTSGELLISTPPPSSLSLLAAATGLQQQEGISSSALPGHIASGSTNEAVHLGGVTEVGAVVSEVVVARVVGPAPRVQVSPVVPDGGCLPVGCTAWLGVLLNPLHDVTLRWPRLHIQPNQLISLATAVAPGVLLSSGLAGGASSDSVTQQSLEQQQLGFGVHSYLGGRSGSFNGPTGLTAQQVGGNWVYVVQLQQQQQQEAAATGAAAAAVGRWLPVSRGSVDLSEVAEGGLCCPLLIWMQVLVGNTPATPVTIKVAKPTAAPPPAAAAPPPPPPPATAPAAAPGLSRLSTVASSGALMIGSSSSTGSSSQNRVTLAAAAAAPGSPSTAAAAGSKVQLDHAAAAAALSKVVPDQCLLLACRPRDVAAELALQLEYSAGVWRSHSCCLQLPLQQPATIAASALQLPTGAIALSITISLDQDASSSLLLLDAALRPQYGLHLGSTTGGLPGPSLAEVLPMRVLPGGSAGLCFMLAQDAGDKLTGSFEVDGSSLLLLSYVLESVGNHTTVTDPETGQQLPAPAAAPAAAGTDTAAAAAAVGDKQDALLSSSSSFCNSGPMSLRLPFWLEFPSCSAAAATASLRATLLGSYSGKVGQPLVLSWQLARIGGTVGFSNISLNGTAGGKGSTAAEGSTAPGSMLSRQQQQQLLNDRDFDEMLCYELLPGQPSGSSIAAAAAAGNAGQSDLLRVSSQAPAALGAMLQGITSSSSSGNSSGKQAPAWWVGDTVSGMVRLGRAAGSLAAIEVVLTPQSAGRHIPPQLMLRSLGGNQPLLVEPGVAGSLWVVDEQCIHISS